LLTTIIALIILLFPFLGNNMKKCRARYGLDQQSQWCKPCRYVCYGRHAFFQSCALAMKQSSDRAYNLYDLRVHTYTKFYESQ